MRVQIWRISWIRSIFLAMGLRARVELRYKKRIYLNPKHRFPGNRQNLGTEIEA